MDGSPGWRCGGRSPASGFARKTPFSALLQLRARRVEPVPGGSRTGLAWMARPGSRWRWAESITVDLAWRYSDPGEVQHAAGSGPGRLAGREPGAGSRCRSISRRRGRGLFTPRALSAAHPVYPNKTGYWIPRCHVVRELEQLFPRRHGHKHGVRAFLDSDFDNSDGIRQRLY